MFDKKLLDGDQSRPSRGQRERRLGERLGHDVVGQGR